MDRKLAVRPLVACLTLSLLAACVSTDPARRQRRRNGGRSRGQRIGRRRFRFGFGQRVVLDGQQRDRRGARHRARRRLAHAEVGRARSIPPSEGNAVLLPAQARPDGHRNHAGRRLVHRTPRALPARQRQVRRRRVGRQRSRASPAIATTSTSSCARRSPATRDVYGKSEVRIFDAKKPGLRPAELRRRRADLPQRPQLGGRRQRGGLLQRVLRRAQAGRHAGLRRPSREGGHRPADADQERLPHRGTGEEVRAGRRLRARRRERGQREPEGHDRSPQRRVDAAAEQPARQGRRREVPGDRRKRSHDAALQEARG